MRCSTSSSRRSCSRRAASTASSPRTPWATMSSSTPTQHAKPCSSDSTSCASNQIRRATSLAAASPTSSRPKETGLRDHIGAFAVTTGIGLKELCESFRAEHDDYNAIMAEALADRLAEAFAECLHKRVRDEWGYGRAESLSKPRSDSREVSRHPAGGRLPSLPRSHREGSALAAARRRGEHRHADHRVVRDVARLERERPLLRASRSRAISASARSTATRSSTTASARA